MTIKIELVTGEIKEYEIKNENQPYLELIQKMRQENIRPEDLKNIIQ